MTSRNTNTDKNSLQYLAFRKIWFDLHRFDRDLITPEQMFAEAVVTTSDDVFARLPDSDLIKVKKYLEKKKKGEQDVKV